MLVKRDYLEKIIEGWVKSELFAQQNALKKDNASSA